MAEAHRVTQTGLEVFAGEDPPAPPTHRVTQTGVEALVAHGEPPAVIRGTQVGVEVLVEFVAPPENQRPSAPTLSHADVTHDSATILRTPGTDPENDEIVAVRLMKATTPYFERGLVECA